MKKIIRIGFREEMLIKLTTYLVYTFPIPGYVLLSILPREKEGIVGYQLISENLKLN